MMNKIFAAMKEVFLSYSPSRSLIEAMLKIDFKIGDRHTNFIQLCFSNLASWPLILILTLIAIDPFKSSWSLIKLFSDENSFVLYLLDGHTPNMLVVFAVFYFLEWIIRKEYLLLAVIFYFLNKSELHIHLAVSAVSSIYLSRICYLWWLSVDTESESKRIWKSVSLLQFVAWIFAVISALSALDYIQINHLFNEAGDFNRFNFLAVMVLFYHVFSHLFLSLWGHFSFQKETEPSNLPTYFSTANWILRFKMSYYLLSLLKNQITQQLANHLQSQVQFQDLKQQNPNLVKFSIEQVLQSEINFLKEAQLRIGKI